MQGFEAPFHSSIAISYSCIPIWPWDKVFCEAKKELKQLSSKWVENTLTSGGFFCLLSGLSPNLTTSSVPQDLPPPWPWFHVTKLQPPPAGEIWAELTPWGKKLCQMRQPAKYAKCWISNGKLVGGRSATRRNLAHFSEHFFGQMNYVKPFKTLPSGPAVVPKSERSGRTPGLGATFRREVFHPTNPWSTGKSG